jgi:hypothetical protein
MLFMRDERLQRQSWLSLCCSAEMLLRVSRQSQRLRDEGAVLQSERNGASFAAKRRVSTAVSKYFCPETAVDICFYVVTSA